jgi:hypothetical protein
LQAEKLAGKGLTCDPVPILPISKAIARMSWMVLQLDWRCAARQVLGYDGRTRGDMSTQARIHQADGGLAGAVMAHSELHLVPTACGGGDRYHFSFWDQTPDRFPAQGLLSKSHRS